MIYQVNFERGGWLVSGSTQRHGADNEIAVFKDKLDALKCAKKLNATIFKNNDYSTQAIIRGDKEQHRLMIQVLNQAIKLEQLKLAAGKKPA